MSEQITSESGAVDNREPRSRALGQANHAAEDKEEAEEIAFVLIHPSARQLRRCVGELRAILGGRES